MRIVEIRERAFPVRSSMRNAAFDFSEMTTSIVAVVTDVVRAGGPVTGFAFNSTGRYACGAVMRQRLIPRLLAAEPESLLTRSGDTLDPEKALACMMQREKPGGHSERSIPIGTIETAIWDAAAKILDRPLWHLLAERYNGGRHAHKVFCYVGGGWYRPGGTLEDLADEIRNYRDAGYSLVKIKVGGAPLKDDIARIETALKIVGDPNNLAVDANAAFSREHALAYAGAMAPFGLRWFEEPLDPLDLKGLAGLAASYEGALATGENLFSLQDVTNVLDCGGFRPGLDIMQVDPPQAYGLSTYASIADLMRERGFGTGALFPHGGNLMSFAAAAGFELGGCESYPDVFGAFGGYGEGMAVEDGWMKLPDAPGIGFERHPAFHRLARELVADL